MGLDRSVWCLVLVGCCYWTCVGGDSGDGELGPSLSRTQLTIPKRWELIEEKLKKAIENMNNYLPSTLLTDQLNNSSLGEQCFADLSRLADGIREMKSWAFPMLDATGTNLNGAVTGLMGFYGHYDQCLNIRVKNETEGLDNPPELFRGKYCIAEIQPYLPPKPHFYKLERTLTGLESFVAKGTGLGELARFVYVFYLTPLRWGLCLPSTCGEEELNQTLIAVGKSYNLNMHLSQCEVKSTSTLKPIEKAVISIFGVLITVTVLATVVDMWMTKRKMAMNHTGLKLLMGFCVTRNCKKIFDTSGPSSALSCLHGMRVLTITWIICAHTYYNVNFSIVRGGNYASTVSSDIFFQVIANGTVAVDTFFLIGAILLSKNLVEYLMIKKKPFNLGVYLLHRFWRFTPSQMALIALTFLPFLGPGPQAYDVMRENLENCRNYWWRNLLYIHNFFESQDMCHRLTWYLATDFQLYIFSLLILLPLVRRPSIGLTLNCFFMVLCCIASGMVTYWLDLPPTMLVANPDRRQLNFLLTRQYFYPHAHMPVYGVGIIIGYLLATREKFVIKLRVQLVLWTVSVVSALAALYGTHQWNSGRDYRLAETVAYSALHRPAWAFAVGWVIFACVTGHGGPINRILSWKGWVPVGRLSFSAYLLHMTVQDNILGRSLEMTFNHANWIFAFLNTVGITWVLALVFSLLVECPCLCWEKILLRSSGRGDKN